VTVRDALISILVVVAIICGIIYIVMHTHVTG
jgi:hypothetical protein